MQRHRPAKDRIERALRGQLQRVPLVEISVSDLCRAAQVSRSTFYTYFSNIGDVYETCVRELADLISPIRPQLRCSNCVENVAGKPLCHVIRESDEYKGLVREDQFLVTFLKVCYEAFQRDSVGVFDNICSQKEIVYALQCFQLAGCIMTAKGIPESQEWTPIKTALDSFIKGGLDEVRGKHF